MEYGKTWRFWQGAGPLDHKGLTADHVEGFANGVNCVLRMLDLMDGGGKSYDPMTIDEKRRVAHSYLFDLWDGGRHHDYETLGQVMDGVEEEALLLIRDYGDHRFHHGEAYKAAIKALRVRSSLPTAKASSPNLRTKENLPAEESITEHK